MGKVAIVTGAGSNGPGVGNGKAAAIVYAREGAKVLLVDRRHGAAEETKGIIDGEGGESSVFAADVSSSKDCQAMVAACIDRYGRIDILHNNVAIPGEPGGPVEVSEESWDETIAVNLTSIFLTCKHVLPHMERQGGGSIVNISSVGAIRARLHRANVGYSVSKAGIDALGRDVAIQYRVERDPFQHDPDRRGLHARASSPNGRASTWPSSFASAERRCRQGTSATRSTLRTRRCSSPRTKPGASPERPWPSTAVNDSVRSSRVAIVEGTRGGGRAT